MTTFVKRSDEELEVIETNSWIIEKKDLLAQKLILENGLIEVNKKLDMFK